LVRRVNALVTDDRSLSGEAIAERLGISPTRLAREFRRDTGETLVSFRNEIRLQHFFELVRPGGANLLEAALQAGFGSYAQFHRVFKARFGHGPRKYFEDHPRKK
jgi:AraC-like DNA-binding protein